MEPVLACIGGSAAYRLLCEGAFVGERLGPQQTPFGESQPIYLCRGRFGEFYFLSRHGDHLCEMAPCGINFRANIYALKDLGVRSIVSWSSTRAISHNYRIGEYAIASDLIDETRSRAVTMFPRLGLGDVRQWPVFCPSLGKALGATLEVEECEFKPDGVYVCIEGPRRATPAEVRKYGSFGGELLGATLAPEVFLAKELQMCYAALCYVTSYAENGSDFRPFENGRVLDVDTERSRAQSAVERFPRILERLCEQITHTPSICRCDSLMQHHIDAGHIGTDWRTWFDDQLLAAPPARQDDQNYVDPYVRRRENSYIR
ncbi:MAG: phosphorylase [Planctomycetota bacterium]|nr:MAG: phosphorylase [Planctomycetota bacterium]